MATVDRAEPGTGWRNPIRVLVAVAAIIAALALLWIADEFHYRSCVEHAVGEFPTVPVSAYVQSDRTNVGPLKVSFSAQRVRAINACHHL